MGYITLILFSFIILIIIFANYSINKNDPAYQLLKELKRAQMTQLIKFTEIPLDWSSCTMGYKFELNNKQIKVEVYIQSAEMKLFNHCNGGDTNNIYTIFINEEEITKGGNYNLSAMKLFNHIDIRTIIKI